MKATVNGNKDGVSKTTFNTTGFSDYVLLYKTDNDTNPEQLEFKSDSQGNDKIKGILGNAYYYGIVANQWTQSEAESNFAVKKLVASAQTGNTASYSSSNTQHMVAGKWEKIKVIIY